MSRRETASMVRGTKARYTPSDRLDALHRVAHAARLFMRAEAEPSLEVHARMLNEELATLDTIEAYLRGVAS